MNTPTPQNLSPMEALLLESLTASSTEHEKRLSELETLLKQLVEQSPKDSDSARSAFEALRAQLAQVSKQLTALDTRLTKWEPFLNKLAEQISVSSVQSQAQTETYNKAIEAFNLMKAKYQTLASEVAQLRTLAG